MLGQRLGYIRVSSLDQQVARQLEGIEIDKTFTDKASGKDAKRPQLELLLSFVRTGDTVFVHSMDRLARNLDDLRRIVQTLAGKGGADRVCQRTPLLHGSGATHEGSWTYL
jgi:DNA invertase Pin-like site-specific DNA recombinase